MMQIYEVSVYPRLADEGIVPVVHRRNNLGSALKIADINNTLEKKVVVNLTIKDELFLNETKIVLFNDYADER
jgi:hypothetical protein